MASEISMAKKIRRLSGGVGWLAAKIGLAGLKCHRRKRRRGSK